MPYTADPRVDAYIGALPGWQQAICQQVRDLVHAADPEVTETIKRTRQPYFVLHGNICALLAAKDHVNVFLYDDASVPDPEGIITSGHGNKYARTVAIREGVLKSLRVTQHHLRAIYDNVPYRFTTYDSRSIGKVRQFAQSCLDRAGPFGSDRNVRSGLSTISVRQGSRWLGDGVGICVHVLPYAQSPMAADFRTKPTSWRPASASMSSRWNPFSVKTRPTARRPTATGRLAKSLKTA